MRSHELRTSFKVSVSILLVISLLSSANALSRLRVEMDLFSPSQQTTAELNTTTPKARRHYQFHLLRDSLTMGILNFEPEELRMLGYRGAAGQLKDWSPEAIANEVNFCREALTKLHALQLTDPDDILDQAILRSHFTYLIHYYGQYHGELSNVQISAYPYELIEYELQRFATDSSASEKDRLASAVDHFSAVEGVLRGIPAYLNQQQINLIAGIKLRAPDKNILNRMIDRIGETPNSDLSTICAALRGLHERLDSAELQSLLPSYQIHNLQNLIEGAEVAYDNHARFLKGDLLRHAKDSWSLGKDEYVRRLALIYGYTQPLTDLVEPAEKDLQRIKNQMKAISHQLRPDLPQDDLLPARVLTELKKQTSASDQELLDTYRRVQTTIDDRITKRIGLPAGAVVYISAPTGIPVSPATNWPAPLLSIGSALVLVNTSSRGLVDNASVDLPWIAVHEGNPGHAAQSVLFRSAFSKGTASLCRFLNVPDEVGYVRGNWYAMANIEGWALYAERLLLSSDLLTPEQQLAALSGQALRAARVIVDIRMHTAGWTREQGARYLITEAAQTAAVAERETYRYSRIPLQALSYYMGARQFEELAHKYAARFGDNFYEQVLSLGPVPPSLIDNYFDSTIRTGK